ncbi:MAG: hypothetical protein ABI857_07800, partial [Acidobacteriota bacterium]
MKKFLSFACALCVFGPLTVAAQTTSKIATSDPFQIEQGSSFSASTTPRTSAAIETRSSTPAAGKIVSDVREALDLIRRKHVAGSKLNDADLMKSSVGAMLA